VSANFGSFALSRVFALSDSAKRGSAVPSGRRSSVRSNPPVFVAAVTPSVEPAGAAIWTEIVPPAGSANVPPSGLSRVTAIVST
jgi:hypothetical protein